MSGGSKVDEGANVSASQSGCDVLRDAVPNKERRVITRRLFCQFRVQPDLSVEVVWTTTVSEETGE